MTASGFRVAMVGAFPFPALQGSQVLFRELGDALAARGHEVEALVYHFGLPGPPPAFRVHRIPGMRSYRRVRAGPSLRKPLLDLRLFRRLLRLVSSEPFDLIHAHNYEAAVVALAVKTLRGIPVLYHSHNALAEELPLYFRSGVIRPAARLLGRLLDRTVPARADFCIAISPDLVPYLEKAGVKGDRIAHIPPAIGLPEPSRRATVSVRKTWGLGKNRLVIYAGNLDGYQDLDLLLQSAPLFLRRVPDTLLLLVSHSPPDEALVRMAKSGGIGERVRFLRAGDFGETWELLRAAEVAVCPRRGSSGFPIKMLNYMAAGRAVVACAGSAHPLRHMETGIVVAEQTGGALAEGVSLLLENEGLRNALGRAARRRYLERYTWEKAVPAIEEIYLRLLGGREAG